MRRMWISLLLLALGVFLVIAAGLSRFYVADQAVKIPAGQYARTVAVGHGTFFDAGSLSEQQADITAVRNVVPDVPASSRSTDVWQVGLQLKTGDGRLVSASIDRVALDRKTADAVNCCGEAVASALDPSGKLKPVRHSGLSYQFPISTKKQTYQFWDVTPEQALPTRYASQETVQGLTTYKFVQEIAPMQIGTAAARWSASPPARSSRRPGTRTSARSGSSRAPASSSRAPSSPAPRCATPRAMTR